MIPNLNNDSRTEHLNGFVAALKANDESGVKASFEAYCNEIKTDILNEARSQSDAAIRQGRGEDVLTSKETAYYNKLIDFFTASSNKNSVRMALGELDVVMPQTIVERIFEGMKREHPLLQDVDFVSADATTKYIYSKDTGDVAQWGELNGAITKELSSGFGVFVVGMNKLSAWLPIHIDMLKLGPKWLHAYIVTCLSESMSAGMEMGIITGTGNNMPIGMDRDIADDVAVVGGVYPQKAAIKVDRFDMVTYCDLVSRLASDRNGKPRAVGELILVVNPVDYLQTVLPATSTFVNGEYRKDVFPWPTKAIQSVAVAHGEAILGIGKQYLAGGGGNRGIEFSDDAAFLEDKRLYKSVLYGNGIPKDNNSFLRLDISGLKRLVPETLIIDQATYSMEIAATADTAEAIKGKNVADLQTSVSVIGNTVTGTLHYVEGYTGYSDKAAEQKGYFLALLVGTTPVNADKVTAEIIGVKPSKSPAVVDATNDDVVLRIEDKDKQLLQLTAYKNTEIKKRILSLSGLTLEPQE